MCPQTTEAVPVDSGTKRGEGTERAEEGRSEKKKKKNEHTH